MTSTHADLIAAALLRVRGGGRAVPHGPGAHDAHRGPHAGRRHHGRRAGGPAQMRMLIELQAANRALTVTELAELIGVDQPRASRLVAQSVEQGFVRREVDPDDARRTRIALTPEGQRVAGRILAGRSERIEAALVGFSETERAELARLLTKLADAWHA